MEVYTGATRRLRLNGDSAALGQMFRPLILFSVKSAVACYASINCRALGRGRTVPSFRKQVWEHWLQCMRGDVNLYKHANGRRRRRESRCVVGGRVDRKTLAKARLALESACWRCRRRRFCIDLVSLLLLLLLQLLDRGARALSWRYVV